MQKGVTMVKYFPAELSGGVEMLKVLDNLYPVQFMPTGGITLDNINEYLDISSVVACGGTWLLPNELIISQSWDERLLNWSEKRLPQSTVKLSSCAYNRVLVERFILSCCVAGHKVLVIFWIVIIVAYCFQWLIS